nr:uncharacterized mitochondrial protein AtMg00810-like [Tanacetum cinerariifolium]
MHKAFPLPAMEFPLPKEVPTASEESSHCQKKRDATAVKIALLLKSRRNYQSKSYDSFAKTVTVTADDMQKRKNDVKARTTLLLSLPDEHQLRFSKYKTAQELWAAILKTFGGNEATKKTKKNLLKQQYNNFKAKGSETLEQTFNRLQIDEDDMEEMDIKWNMALLSMRADRFWKKTGKKISIQGTEVTGFDKSKVECFNCHKTGYFVRECRALRSQDRGRGANYKQRSKVEEHAPKALMEIDGVGWDWSYMVNDEENHALVADKEAPTEFALMANNSAESKVFDNSLCSKDCKKNTDSLNSKITDLTDKLFDAKNMIYHYKLGLAQVKSRLAEHRDREIKYYEKIRGLEFKTESSDDYIESLKKELELIKKEKEGLDSKLTSFQTASKDLDSLLESQRLDKNKEGLGYSDVPPPLAQIYSPSKKDMSWTGLPKFKDDTVTDYSRPAPNVESSPDDAQNKNPSVTETEASPSTISPKSFIKFVKANDSPTNSKTDKAETAKKPHVNSQNNIDDKGYWDSGCSRHMTGNISYISDYEPLDGGYVSFGQGGCKITGKGTIKTGKFEAKGDEGYFIRYSMSSKAFRVFNKRTRRVEENLHVEFLENKAIEKGAGPNWLFDINSLTKSINYVPVDASTNSTNLSDDCSTDVPESSGNSNPTATSTNPPADQLETLKVETPIPTVSSPVPTTCLNDSPEPSSNKRLISKRVANQVETPSLDNILTLTNRFEDILGVTTNSVDSDGVEAYVSYMETTITASPTSTLRIYKDHPKSQIISPVDTLIQTKNKSKEMDVKSTFLYGTIDEEVYVMQPPGFQDPEFPAKVYKVEKAMYGLHQAPRAWYGTLSKYLLTNGFQRGTIDQTLFIRRQRRDFILVQVYVDDIIFGSSNPQLCREFKAFMHEKFQMSAMGELNFFLGLQVLQKEDGIFLSPDKYVGDILKKFRYSDVRSSNTPMDKENPWGKDRTGKDVDLHLYRSMIGSLMYLTASRPDIMFAVCAYARHQVTPKECHLHAVYQMDVKSAFLYGTIDEEVYVMQPSGFQDPNFPAKVYKVEKAMYGLHQAPRAWYDTLSKYLLTNGFQNGTIDQTLFIRRQRGDFILLQVYVDDIIFGSSNPQLCREFEAFIHENFQMSAMGELNFFLGLQVLQKKDVIFLSQEKYVGDILKKFRYSDVRSSNTPMDKENPWGKDETRKDVDLHLYRSMIGSLMYLTASRPDIMFSICACARHQVTSKECHLHAVKRIFRYLKGHPKLEL